jgi:hypothetical protein
LFIRHVSQATAGAPIGVVGGMKRTLLIASSALALAAPAPANPLPWPHYGCKPDDRACLDKFVRDARQWNAKNVREGYPPQITTEAWDAEMVREGFPPYMLSAFTSSSPSPPVTPVPPPPPQYVCMPPSLPKNCRVWFNVAHGEMARRNAAPRVSRANDFRCGDGRAQGNRQMSVGAL